MRREVAVASIIRCSQVVQFTSLPHASNHPAEFGALPYHLSSKWAEDLESPEVTMNGKKFVLLFFLSAILVSILAVYLGMLGTKAR